MHTEWLHIVMLGESAQDTENRLKQASPEERARILTHWDNRLDRMETRFAVVSLTVTVLYFASPFLWL